MSGIVKKSLAGVVLGFAALFLASIDSYSRADEPTPDLSELRDAVKSADKRGANVHEIQRALDALEKSLARGFKAPGVTPPVPPELTALRNAVETARKKGENVEEIAKQLVAVETAMAGKAPAKPEPPAERPPLYYPTGTGAAWVYRRPSGDDPVFSVIGVEPDGNTVVVSIQNDIWYYGKGVYAKMIVSAEGLRQVEGRDHKEGWILKTGLPSGSSWKGPDKTKRTGFGPEEVKTRAGKFQALRVMWYEGAELHTAWYAPNIGEVKYVVSYKGETTYEYELRSFTPPKKE